ncbi:MAG TPA: hypothetical protein DHU75_00310, partial [Rikenellaceae bacterium]|nr:hypothetical protein [Rikenellaceae bacterium]
EFFNNSKEFELDSVPMEGDIMLWEGHVGIVSQVYENGKIKLIHASWSKQAIAETKPNTVEATKGYIERPFIGFFRPRE